MKIDHIVFVDERGNEEPRAIFGCGRVRGLAVGQVVRDAVEGEAIVDSLEFDSRSGVILIRKRAKEGGNPKAARSWNRTPGETDRHVADVCGIHVGKAHFFMNDADQAPKQQKAQQPAQAPSAPIQADGEKDPPPSKPTGQNGQQQKGK